MFKVGDKVIVKNFESTKDAMIVAGTPNVFAAEMLKFCGKPATIMSFYGGYKDRFQIDLDHECHYWHESWLSKLEKKVTLGELV